MYPPSSPRCRSYTPAYIHPQLLSLPSSTSFSPARPFLLLYIFAVCSLIIQRFFLSPFSSKLCAPLRLILYYTCSTSLSLTLFLPVDDFSALCIPPAFTKDSERTIPHNDVIHSILLYPLFFWPSSIFHSDRWLFVSLSYYLASPAPSVAAPSILSRFFVTACSHRYRCDRYRANIYIYKD